MARMDWLWESLKIKDNTAAQFFIIGLLLFIVYRQDFSNKKNIKDVWKNMKYYDKTLLLVTCLWIGWWVFEIFSKPDIEEDKK